MRFEIAFFLTLLFSGLCFAKECGLEVALRDPKIANNSQFWDDYAKLKSTEDTEAVSALLKKYGHSEAIDLPAGSSTATRPLPQRSAQISIERKAEKEIAALPKNLQTKVDEFMTSMAKPGGVLEIRNNPGRYHLERLAEFGDKAYSIRLNDGYRVLFNMDETGVTIRRVNKGFIHGN